VEIGGKKSPNLKKPVLAAKEVKVPFYTITLLLIVPTI
jgi:hypothetical protein